MPGRKTTLIYVDSDSRRASQAYTRFVFEQREALKLKRKRQRRPKPQERDGLTRHAKAEASSA